MTYEAILSIFIILIIFVPMIVLVIEVATIHHEIPKVNFIVLSPLLEIFACFLMLLT